MKYYLILNVIGIVLYCLFGLFQLRISYLFATAIDCYLFICAYSIYKMNMSQLQEDTSNQRETAITGNVYDQPVSYSNNPAPLYGSNTAPSYGSAYEVEGGKTVTFQEEDP